MRWNSRSPSCPHDHGHLCCLMIKSPQYPLILGYPWLCKHSLQTWPWGKLRGGVNHVSHHVCSPDPKPVYPSVSRSYSWCPRSTLIWRRILITTKPYQLYSVSALVWRPWPSTARACCLLGSSILPPPASPMILFVEEDKMLRPVLIFMVGLTLPWRNIILCHSSRLPLSFFKLIKLGLCDASHLIQIQWTPTGHCFWVPISSLVSGGSSASSWGLLPAYPLVSIPKQMVRQRGITTRQRQPYGASPPRISPDGLPGLQGPSLFPRLSRQFACSFPGPWQPIPPSTLSGSSLLWIVICFYYLPRLKSLFRGFYLLPSIC